MRNGLARRSSVAVALLSACFAMMMGVSTASAYSLPYYYQGAPVKVTYTGGDAVALNECKIAVATGDITLVENECDQFATAGNTVMLTADTILVTKLPSGMLFSYNGPVTVTVSGGTSVAVNKCVIEAQNGNITLAQNFCKQIAIAGNTVNTIATSVTVTA